MTETKAPTGFIGPNTLDTTWQTPPELVERVAHYFGGRLPFDVCTTADNPCGAEDYWTEGALERTWPDRWWCNPPYGRALTKGGWLAKIAKEGARSEGIVLLSAARWEQYPMQQMLAQADHLCFIRKRVDFIRAETGEPVSGNTYANFFAGFNTDWDRWRDAYEDVGLCLAIAGASVPPEHGIKIPRARRHRKAAN